MTETAERSGTALTPVYIPWATLISSLDSLHANGIPETGKIDKTLWDTQSGAIQSQLLIAYRFLGFIDSNNKVLPALPPIVDAAPEKRKPLLKTLIESKYKTIITLGLESISSGQLKEAFAGMNVSGSTQDRAVRFFVKACQELGIPISKRISEKVRAAGAPRKSRRSNSPKTSQANGEDGDTDTPMSRSSWEEKLLSKFPKFDPSWSEDLKTKWFAGFKDLMDSKPKG